MALRDQRAQLLQLRDRSLVAQQHCMPCRSRPLSSSQTRLETPITGRLPLLVVALPTDDRRSDTTIAGFVQRPRVDAPEPLEPDLYPLTRAMSARRRSSSRSIDVQAQLPAVRVSLSRVGVTGVEKVIRLRQNGTEQLFSARFECVVDLGPDQKGAHMSRFEEVVNEAIGEVVLGESTFKAETLAEHIAAARARAPGRAPRRGHRRGALPRAQAGPRVRDPDAGAVHAARLGDRHRARHPPADRRHRAGHHRLPVRPGAGRRRRARAARGPRASTSRRDRADPRRRSRSRPTTSAGSARCSSAAPSCATTRSTRRALLEIVEHSMSSEIYELMKRSDEAHVVEKAHRRPRFVEDCVREMIGGVVERVPEPRRPRVRLRAPGQPRDDPPAQRRRRAVRHARRDPARARHRRAGAAAHEPARLARRGR